MPNNYDYVYTHYDGAEVKPDVNVNASMKVESLRDKMRVADTSEKLHRKAKLYSMIVADEKEHTERKINEEWPYDLSHRCTCSPDVISNECPWHGA